MSKDQSTIIYLNRQSKDKRPPSPPLINLPPVTKLLLMMLLAVHLILLLPFVPDWVVVQLGHVPSRLTVFLTQGLLPILQAAGNAESPSRIVNISSIAGTMPHSLSAYSYGASKAAVNQLTKNLASDLVRKYINVNAIAPGFFKTNMTAHYEDEQMLKFIPMNRFGQAEDIVGLTLFLCSKAGNYMTGNSIALDGGIMVG